MLVRTNLHYTPALLRANPNFLFVFGDNLMRAGKGGQAAIRDEPNARGLATKVSPHNFFTDNEIHEIAISNEILRILKIATFRMVVIPFTDRVELGTGLSELPTRAPLLYEILKNTFTADIPRAALTLPHINPVEVICSSCGGDEVRKDAFAEWDTKLQQWTLNSTYDFTICDGCGEEDCAREVELT